jgi:hypothetical protein
MKLLFQNKEHIFCPVLWILIHTCVSGPGIQEGQKRPAVGAGQVERSYPFDRFHMLKAKESLLLQDSMSPD